MDFSHSIEYRCLDGTCLDCYCSRCSSRWSACVNPTMTLAMVSMNKCTGGLSEAYTRISGLMAGGLISFPLFYLSSSSFHWNSLGGPDYSSVSDNDVSAVALLAMNEYVPLIFAVLVLLGVGLLTGSLGDVYSEEASPGFMSGANAKKEAERSRSSSFKNKWIAIHLQFQRTL